MQKFTLLILGALISIGVVAQKPEVVIKKASVDPVIDGVVDDVWAEAGEEYYIEGYGADDDPPTLGDPGETTWQALWTYDGIYVLLRVADDEFYPHYLVEGSNSWEYDKPELYFDVNWTLEDALGPAAGVSSGHYQVAPAFVDGSIDGTLLTCGFNGETGTIIEHAALVEDPSYVAEYYVPWSSLLDDQGVGVDLTGEIGFDVTIIDRDQGEETNRAAVWSNVGDVNSSWNNMDDCGIITLEGAGDAILCEELTLTGGEISKNNGTLQIGVNIVPEDASNQSLIWTVENTSGKAVIDSDGVLTGVIDGEVTVKGATVDGSYLDAEATVTIKGQIVTLNEINIIRNPYFDDADGSAAREWGGWGGDAGTPMPTVQSGIAVCTPIETDATWQYSFSQTGLTAEPDIDYYLSFLAWSDETRPIQVGFEDTEANNWNRYGASSHEYAQDGRSQWNFELGAEPTWYIFDVNFDQMVESTVQLLTYQMGNSGVVTYLDSILLISAKDSAMLTEYEPIQAITVSAEGGTTEVNTGGSLQMNAEVFPAEADYPDVEWSVVAGTGQASIDENGLLQGETYGLVTVVAKAMDDSEVVGELEVSVTWPASIEGRQSPNLHIYPNPASDHIRVFFPAGCEHASIFSSSGALMEKIRVEAQEQYLDISSYAPGVYYIRAGEALGKFVK